MFSVVNMYLDHLKFCVVCINGQSNVCCRECNGASNEFNEPTSFLVQAIGLFVGLFHIGNWNSWPSRA